jgi:hypothetical protein
MAKKWSAQLKFPTTSDTICRIVGASFGPSNSSGNPMVTVETEIVTPEEVEIDGEMVTISGVKAKNYFVTEVKDDAEKTTKRRETFQHFWSVILEIKEPINWDNIDTKPMLGKLVMTFMEPEEEERRADPTAAERAKDKNAKGKVLINPKTRRPMVNYWPKIREFFGLAPNQDGVKMAY